MTISGTWDGKQVTNGWLVTVYKVGLGLPHRWTRSPSFFELCPSRTFAESHSLLLYSDGSVAHIQLAPDERWRTQVDLSRIDDAYIGALLAIEDERFYWHTGFDPLSIARALIQNVMSGEIVSGASTLTMHLVQLWN